MGNEQMIKLQILHNNDDIYIELIPNKEYILNNNYTSDIYLKDLDFAIKFKLNERTIHFNADIVDKITINQHEEVAIDTVSSRQINDIDGQVVTTENNIEIERELNKNEYTLPLSVSVSNYMLNFTIPDIVTIDENVDEKHTDKKIVDNLLDNEIYADEMTDETEPMPITDNGESNLNAIGSSLDAFKQQIEQYNGSRFLKAFYQCKKILGSNSLTKNIIILSTIIICVLVIFIITLNYSVPQQLPTESATKMSKELTKIHSLYPNLVIKPLKNSILLTGAIKNDQIFKNIKTILKNKSMVKFNLFIFNDSIVNLRQVLQNNSLNNLIIYFDDDSQTVAFKGIIEDMNKLNDAEIQIANTYPAIGQIDTSNVFISNDINNALNKITNQIDSSHNLTITTDYTKYIINISGYLSTSDIALLHSQISQFKQQFDNLLSVNINVQDTSQAIPFSISATSSGDQGYIITGNGQTVYVGGTIAGLTLEKVTNEEVVFKGKFLIVLKLNDMLGVNPNNDNQLNSRNQLINNELNQESSALIKEKQEIFQLQNIMKSVTESGLKSQIQQEVANLVEDISIKSHELNTFRNLSNN